MQVKQHKDHTIYCKQGCVKQKPVGYTAYC